jgi:hypothetical protein
MRVSAKTMAKRIAIALTVCTALGSELAPVPADAQAIVCCNQTIQVHGGWIGSSRVQDCQGYLDSAPPDILRALCKQRTLLNCINTSRCATLPPEPANKDSETEPDNTDRNGLELGFYGPPPAEPPPAQPPAPRPPGRLAYLAPWPGGGAPAKLFTVWLDRNGCPLALDKNNRLADAGAARHVVRGKVIHRDGRVHIEAEAQERPGGAKSGPVSADATGDDAAAVAEATRTVLAKLKLVCRQ